MRVGLVSRASGALYSKFTGVAELRAMKLKEAAKKVEDGIEETLTYCDFPSEHWTRIRTNNVIARLNREIRRSARREECVCVGRCADYVLRDADGRLLRVFVSAPEEQRIARKMEQEHLTQPQAARLLRKMDKQRRKYYETYTHHVWGDSTNYDLCIATSTCTLDEAAARIADRFRAMA